MNKKLISVLIVLTTMLFILPLVSADTQYTFYHNKSLGTSGSTTSQWGFQIVTNYSGQATLNVTRASGVTGTVANFYNSTTFLGNTTNLSGNTFIFNTLNFTDATNTYYITIANAGATYTRYYQSFSTFPVNVANTTVGMNITSNCGGNTAPTLPSCGFGEFQNIQYYSIGAIVSPTFNNVSITAYDFYTNSSLLNFSALISQSNNTLNYADGLLPYAWYLFDSNTQTAPDYSGNGNTGTLNGYVFNNLTFNNILNDTNSPLSYTNPISFNGINSYVSASLSYLDIQSISVYVKVNETNKDNWILIGNTGSGGRQQVVINSSGYILIQFADTTTSTRLYTSSASVITNNNTWYHIGFVRSTGQMYLNGLPISSSSSSTASLAFTGTYFIGRNVAGTSWLNGSITLLRTWNTSLNDSQMLSESQSILPQNANGLTHSYTFNSPYQTYDTNNLVAGQINGSFRFDGVTNKVVTASALSSVSNNNSYSVSMWVKLDSNLQNAMAFMNNPTALDRNVIGLSSTANNYIAFGKFQGAGALSVTAGTPLTVGQWYHVVAVSYDATHYNIYLNGVNSSGGTGVPQFSSNTGLTIGGQITGTRLWNGSIDDVRIYNTSLSATQIQQLYQAGAYRIYNYSTTNGTINTFLYGGIYNITINSTQSPLYYNESLTNYNFTANINQSLEPFYIYNNIFYAYDFYTNSSLSNFSITNINTGSTFNTTTGVINATLFNYYHQYRLYNITYSSNQSGTWFNRSYTSLNTTSSTNSSMAQSITGFTAYEKITGNVISSANFSTQYLTNTTHYMSVQPYSVTAFASGYYNKTITYTPTAFTSTAQNVSYMTASRLNLTVKNALSLANVTTFTATFNNSEYSYTEVISTTNGSIILDALAGNWTIDIDADGFAFDSFNVTLTNGLNNYTAYLYTTESIYFIFRDEMSDDIINTTLISLELIGQYESQSVTTTNGTVYVDLLTPDYYTIRYGASGYTTRFSYITVTNRTTQNVTLYLLNSSDATNITATVYQQDGSTVENALLKVLKYDISSNTYIVREQVQTNFEGKASFSAEYNSEFYKFIVEYPIGNVALTTDPSYIDSTEITLVLTGSVGGIEFINVLGVENAVTYNYATSNFRLDWSDSGNTLSQICLYAYRLEDNFSGTFLNSSCSTSSSGTILLYVNNISGYEYFARAYGTINEQQTFLNEGWADLTTLREFGTLGLVIAVCLTVLISFSFVSSPRTIVLSLPLGLTITQVFGMTYFSMWVPVALWIICIMIVIAMGRNR